MLWRSRQSRNPSSAAELSPTDQDIEALRQSSRCTHPILADAVDVTLAVRAKLLSVKKQKQKARELSDRSIKILETLADAVQPDPLSLSLPLQGYIRRYKQILVEIDGAIAPLTTWKVCFKLGKGSEVLDGFIRRLDDLDQACKDFTAHASPPTHAEPAPDETQTRNVTGMFERSHNLDIDHSNFYNVGHDINVTFTQAHNVRSLDKTLRRIERVAHETAILIKPYHRLLWLQQLVLF